MSIKPATGRKIRAKPTGEVLASLNAHERATLVALYSHMRSGAGFHNDLRSFDAAPPQPITQPTLVIASRNDAAVPIAHAESLVNAIPHAELVASQADSHLIWFGSDYPVIANRIRSFLTAD